MKLISLWVCGYHETWLRRRLNTVLFRITDFQFITNNMQITVGYKIVIFLLFFHTSAEFGLWYWGENTCWGWTRKWGRAGYLYLGGRKSDESRESCMRNRFVMCVMCVRGLTKSRRIRMVEDIARRVKINVCSVLVWKAKGKTLFRKKSYEG
jgi:hypothetical protein